MVALERRFRSAGVRRCRTRARSPASRGQAKRRRVPRSASEKRDREKERRRRPVERKGRRASRLRKKNARRACVFSRAGAFGVEDESPEEDSKGGSGSRFAGRRRRELFQHERSVESIFGFFASLTEGFSGRFFGVDAHERRRVASRRRRRVPPRATTRRGDGRVVVPFAPVRGLCRSSRPWPPLGHRIPRVRSCRG